METVWVFCHCQIAVASHPINILIHCTPIINIFRFCQTRWVEDSPVADHVLEVWLSVLKIINYWEGLCKSSRPSTKFYQVVVNHYTGKLIPCKLQLFLFIASIFKPYLRIFQTNSTMLSFMYEKLKKIFTKLSGLTCKKMPSQLTKFQEVR